ncbi:Y-family DNA polymerase [Paraburkholderia fungorum]|uniref:Y-family DNA polymerase n=1 Tax=Paraburkholderia fungorum TaxID=134537 RepID=UPI00160D37B1|nr:DNA polymerase Y family protein [Paraburkholderia fungorum]MBB5547801.1 protein ImuB [Paraburkholderia fungorum]
MQLWIGVHLPRLPLESFRPNWSKSATDERRGLVVLDPDRVIALDAAARELGVVAGMRRGGVLTLAPDADIRVRDPAREEEIIRGVAVALLQFSSQVVMADESVVLVDVSASLRLFGGIRALRRSVQRALQAFGVSTRIAIAPTGQAAWLLARSRGGVALSLRSALRLMGRAVITTLPAARRYAEWFTGLGCATLADLQRLPRAGLKKRCGVELLDALDRATGAAPEVYDWLEVPPAFDARLELPDRIEHAEAMLFAARRLIVQMTGWLSARQMAIARFTLALEHERGRAAIAPTLIDVALAEPTWHEEHLVRLLRERLARLDLEAPVIALRLEATDVREAEAPSGVLFIDPGGSAKDHAQLLELLVARLGAENVLRASPTSDHRPEDAARWVPLADRARGAVPASDLPRPAWLLEEPLQLMMRGHRPLYGTPLRLVSPGERIECGWHDRHIVTRDYFVAESEDFLYYWIFRERVGSRDEDREPRWFLHGLFG